MVLKSASSRWSTHEKTAIPREVKAWQRWITIASCLSPVQSAFTRNRSLSEISLKNYSSCGWWRVHSRLQAPPCTMMSAGQPDAGLVEPFVAE